MKPPQTTLAPNAPWPTTAELEAAIAAANAATTFHLEWQNQAKKSNLKRREIKKVKP